MSQKKRSLSWVLLHLLVIVFAFLSLLTGLRMAAVTRPEILKISALLPQGYVHIVHLISAACLVSVVVAYLILLFVEPVRRFKRGSFHHRITQLGYLIILSSMVTGGVLYFGSEISMLELHYYSALVFVLYLVLHAVLIFVEHGKQIFIRISISESIKPKDYQVLAAGVIVFAFLALFFQPVTDKKLYIAPIPITEFIDIDGLATEEIWKNAQSITVNTHGGANFIDGSTPVTVRALHNGEEAYFHISWLDKTRSLRHLPLVKTSTGWQVVEDGFYQFDERTHYEDKFAIMLANNCDAGASKTASLGPKPLKNKPANWHGKGYHYASDGQIRDIWHWKAVRTNDMFLADDNFFGEPDIVRNGQRRYTAGYMTDGKESGAYIMNWQWYSPKGVVPKRLPLDKDNLDIYQNENTENWVVPWYDFNLYEQKSDNFPVGAIAPSVLHYSNRFEGDRAHVRARAEWREGRWSLELVRPLDTKSEKDVVIKTGVCFWVSAFDHSQIAHTRHVRPLRLVVGE